MPLITTDCALPLGRRYSLPAEPPLPWEGAGGGDERLRHLVPLMSRAAGSAWALVSTHLPGRSGRECRERWSNLIQAAV